MTSNHYDTIIISAGQSDLTLFFGRPSPQRRWEQKPPFSQGLAVIDL